MRGIEDLPHNEFKELYIEGKIEVIVDRNMAMQICDKDPRIRRTEKGAHGFWKWVGIFMLIGGPISMLFIKWYLGLSILCLSIIIMNATRKSACGFVVNTALKDEGFYNDMLANKVLALKKS